MEERLVRSLTVHLSRVLTSLSTTHTRTLTNETSQTTSASTTAKYDEPDENLITSQQLERMCDGDYPVRFFRRMEKQVLNQLNWSVASASAYHFLHYFTQRSNVRRPHVAWNAPDVSAPYSHTQKVLEMCIKGEFCVARGERALAPLITLKHADLPIDYSHTRKRNENQTPLS